MGYNQNVYVSVIVPVYNVEQYLHTCLDHLVSQTMNEIEIILINDCSTDSCGIICEEYAKKDKRFRVTHNTSNIKQGLSLNKGIELAKGEYISFLDADDWVDYDYYEKLYLTAKKENSDIAKTGLTTLYQNGKVVKSDLLNSKIKTGLKKRMPLCMLFTHEYTTAIYRRKILIEHSIRFPDIRNALDIIFLLHVTHYSKSISIISGTYYYYRHHINSITHINSKPYFESSLHCFRLHLDFINTHVLDKNVYDFLFYRGLIGVTKRYPLFEGKPELIEYKKEYVQKALENMKLYKYDAGFLINNLLIGIYREDQLSIIMKTTPFQLFVKMIQLMRRVKKERYRLFWKIKGLYIRG